MKASPRTSRPSPAFVVALVALVAAVAGTAIADPVASTSALSKKKVKKIAKKEAAKAVNAQFPVQESQIADGAVSGAKIADGGVGAADLGANSVNAAKLAPNAVGASELKDVTLRTGVMTIEDDATPFEQNEVDCQNNEQAISGHVQLAFVDSDEVGISRTSYDPTGGAAPNDTGWIFGISNLDDVGGIGDADDATLSVQVGVLCLAV
jgi:hypothetical protein